MIRLVIFDLDGTLWDHEDVSSLRLPLERISVDSLEDSLGRKLTLNREARKVLLELTRHGTICSIASWNEPRLAFEALKILDVIQYFTEPVIESHPNKDTMVDHIVRKIRNVDSGLDFSEIMIVDDNSIVLDTVSKAFPGIKCVQYGKDIVELDGIMSLVR